MKRILGAAMWVTLSNPSLAGVQQVSQYIFQTPQVYATAVSTLSNGGSYVVSVKDYGEGLNASLVVKKFYASSLVQKWEKVFPTNLYLYYGNGNAAIDDQGNLIVYLHDSNYGYNGIYKIDADGNLVWQHEDYIRWAPVDSERPLAVDPYGYVITSRRVNGNAETAGVQINRHAPDGSLSWQRTYDPTGGQFSLAVTTDSVGAVYGLLTDLGTSRKVVLKYTSAGELAWTLDLPEWSSFVEHIAIGPGGSVIVAGAQIYKIDAATGTVAGAIAALPELSKFEVVGETLVAANLFAIETMDLTTMQAGWHQDLSSSIPAQLEVGLAVTTTNNVLVSLVSDTTTELLAFALIDGAATGTVENALPFQNGVLRQVNTILLNGFMLRTVTYQVPGVHEYGNVIDLFYAD